MPAKVAAMDSGAVTPAASTAAPRRRNSRTTSITRATLRPSVNSMCSTLVRMLVERSATMEKSIAGDTQRRICGSSSRIASTVSMTLASDCRVTLTRTAGWPLNHAAARLLRTPSSRMATSPRRKVRPSTAFTARVA